MSLPLQADARCAHLPLRTRNTRREPSPLVVPFTPGGSTDLIGRFLTQKFTQLWGTQVIVENRPGAGGTPRRRSGRTRAPDGHTWLLAGMGALAISPHLSRKLPYDSLRDFAPVSGLVTLTNLLSVHPSLPVKNVRELITLAKRQPGALSYASPGIGTNLHLGAELFKLMAGVDIVHVPYKGSAPAITDLMAGQVAVLWDNLPSGLPHVKAGKMRALGVTTSFRAPQLPNVPTIAEAGVAGYESESSFNLMMPAGTPAEIVTRVSVETGRILSSAESRERIEQFGARPAPSTPAALQSAHPRGIRQMGQADQRLSVSLSNKL